MATRPPVEELTDYEMLATFKTSENPAHCGFDEATHTRVRASGIVRIRNRLVHYRALYVAFVEAGQPFMIESLDERASGQGIPAKLVFTDAADHVRASEEQPDVVIWTEPALLDELDPAVREL